LATNKASGLTASIHLTNAKASFIAEGKNGLDAWFYLYADYKARGIRSRDKWATEYKASPHCVTSHSVSTMSQYVGAIERAVKKYGTVANVRKAHAMFVKDKYEYADISNFVVFAPEGQRAKNTDKKVAPATAVTLTRAEGVKRLVAGGVSRKDANNYATMLGLK
jgi:hypothetical protein